MQTQQHWENVYQTKSSTEVSWYQPTPEKSLEMIASTGVPHNGAIIDVGGGASTLADSLLAQGYTAMTVLDISAQALETAKERLGTNADRVQWLVADITTVALPPHSIDVWHDRAVFHFLTNPDDRQRYIEIVHRALKPQGHIIVATFAPDGPTKCSGLDVVRYSPDELHRTFGQSFRLIRSEREHHHTPFGTEQSFVYCYCMKQG